MSETQQQTDAQTNWRTTADPFTAVVETVTDWSAATPCAAWSAADLLDHVIDTERDFLTRQQLDLPEATADDPAERWRRHEAGVRQLLADPAVAEKSYDGFFGPTTIGATLADFYGFDLILHRWDLAASQGRQERFSEAELEAAEAACDGFGDHAYAPGIFGPPVEVGEDASRQDRLLARTGRKPR
ncbi:TIGR03086 family protein [Naumannella sp. ID2617S]|nr:TIGR03086 family protein [Naumannella sp. ID2617S]